MRHTYLHNCDEKGEACGFIARVNAGQVNME